MRKGVVSQLYLLHSIRAIVLSKLPKKMYRFCALIALLALLVSSSPTPAELTPRSCSGLGPLSIDVLYRSAPNFPGTGQQFSLNRGYGDNRIISLLTFGYLPQDATGCMLQITIPPLSAGQMAQGTATQANIWTTDPWWPGSAAPTWNSQPAKRAMVATFIFPTDTTENVFQTYLASNVCSDPMSFLVELSDWQSGWGDVDFPNSFEPATGDSMGFALIHSC
jgi:hypothetical protein